MLFFRGYRVVARLRRAPKDWRQSSVRSPADCNAARLGNCTEIRRDDLYSKSAESVAEFIWIQLILLPSTLPSRRRQERDDEDIESDRDSSTHGCHRRSRPLAALVHHVRTAHDQAVNFANGIQVFRIVRQLRQHVAHGVESSAFFAIALDHRPR